MLVLLGALFLAWPRPADLLVIGFVNAAVFTVAALRYRLPQVHVAALVCLVVASLTAFHSLLGNLAGPEAELGRRWLALAGSPSSGSLLTFLAVVLAATAELGMRSGRRLDALYHVVASGALAVLALFLVGLDGATEPGRAALAFAVCGLGCLAVNLRWGYPQLSYSGAVAFLGAIGFTLHWINPDLTVPRLILLTLLLEATGLLALSFLLPAGKLSSSFLAPFRITGQTASVLAILPLIASLEWAWLVECCLCVLWLSALWLCVSLVEHCLDCFTPFSRPWPLQSCSGSVPGCMASRGLASRPAGSFCRAACRHTPLAWRP